MTKEIDIISLTYGGRGLGRVDGKVVFVPFSVPGDKLKVRITKEKKSFAEGVVEEIVAPSAERVEPKCPVFGVCGGCTWQNIDYKSQVEWKEKILRESLERIGAVEVPDFEPPVEAKEPYNYRSRARFQIDGDKWGFFSTSSHDVVDIKECPLVEPVVNETFAALKELLKGKEHGLCHVEIASSPSDKKAVARFYSTTPFAFGKIDFPGATPLLKGVELLRSKPKGKGRGKNAPGRREGPFHSVKKYGKTDVGFSVAGLELKAPGGSFTQVNSAQNEALIERLLDMGEVEKGDKVLDLFCGVGNLTLALARRAKSVTGVEMDSRAVGYAKENATLAGIENVEFIASDVLSWVKNRGGKSLASPLWDVVVLDPPRGGDVKAVKEIARLAPRRIIYVSCSPPTLARDISYLSDSGYAMTQAVLLDMFPQTFHIESIVVLDRV
ncbi:MAG: 23S rRNA (uracil(1939)-C(5))-methyltransferase RlmD [Proteobacteria bacterium]|nr:23S rRNA (uracil(1939)-C(5))-methyltransferase RlmD [Pseudomonadota bacterium]